MNILPFDFFHVSLTLHMYSEAQADPTVAVEVVRHTHYTGLAVRIDLGKTLIFADGGRRQGGFTTYGRDFDISFIVRQWRAWQLASRCTNCQAEGCNSRYLDYVQRRN